MYGMEPIYCIPLFLNMINTQPVDVTVDHLIVSPLFSSLSLSPSQSCSVIFLFASLNLMGVLYNYLADLAQRRSFSETQRYIRSVAQIETQKGKKVREREREREEGKARALFAFGCLNAYSFH